MAFILICGVLMCCILIQDSAHTNDQDTCILIQDDGHANDQDDGHANLGCLCTNYACWDFSYQYTMYTKLGCLCTNYACWDFSYQYTCILNQDACVLITLAEIFQLLVYMYTKLGCIHQDVNQDVTIHPKLGYLFSLVGTTRMPDDAVLGKENPDDEDCSVFKTIVDGANRCV